jgi:hypothetical protein
MALTSKKLIALIVSEYGSLEEAFVEGETNGICLECGAIREGVEPDAENYPCWSCNKDAVSGIENAIITRL